MDSRQRRQFLLSAGALLAVPFAAIAQQKGYARRIGVLTAGAGADPEVESCRAALFLGLRELGWSNLRVDARDAERDPARLRQSAKELLVAQPEVVVVATGNEVTALRDHTASIPIVFTQVPDPVDAGFVDRLGRPMGNATGLSIFNPSICERSLQVLRACAPAIGRVAVVFDPTDPSWPVYVRAIEASARGLGLTWEPAGAHDAAELARALEVFGKSANGALFVLPGAMAEANWDLITQLAAQYRLPAIYPRAGFAAGGGLVSYGVDTPHLWRRAAAYVDRILKGARPADLPVGLPAKFDFAINLRTANALGLSIPRPLLAQADRVIA